MRKAALLVVVVLLQVGFALTRAYSVEPVKQEWSGFTDTIPGQDYVSEILTVNFDTPIKASLFVGAKQGEGAYNVNIYSHPDGNVALAQALNVAVAGSYYWLNCSLSVPHPDSFIKGRKVEVRWTRTGSDSINYYYDFGNPYDYGHMIVGGDGTGWDLCMRVYGVMDKEGMKAEGGRMKPEATGYQVSAIDTLV